MEVLCRSLDVKLEAAESSFEDDKRRILNTIAKRRAGGGVWFRSTSVPGTLVGPHSWCPCDLSPGG